MRIDAVIGLDALGPNGFTIDYKSKKIHFGQPSTMPFSVPLLFVRRFPTVEAKLNGQSVRLLVDTGASGLTLFATRVQGLVPDRGVQNLNLGQEVAFIADDQKDPGRDFDGLLSLPALGFKEVSFDFQLGTIGWKR